MKYVWINAFSTKFNGRMIYRWWKFLVPISATRMQQKVKTKRNVPYFYFTSRLESQCSLKMYLYLNPVISKS
jgi:hypothetical protein